MSRRHDRLTSEVDASPEGPVIGAFFDVDRTLLATFSAIAFIRHGIVSGRTSPWHVLQTALAILRFQAGQLDFESFAAATSASLAGTSEEEFRAIGEAIFQAELASEVYPEARALVRAHQRRGHVICIVSAATSYQVAPIARDLAIDDVLCTTLECRDGVLTGAVLRPTIYGEGKAEAVRRFAAERGLDLSRSWFYSDSHEDLPLLELVGNPRPTNPDARLSAVAARRGWPTRTFTSRGPPGTNEVVRTSLAVASLVPSFLLGVPAAIFDGRWRSAVNVAIATWGEVGCALAGIDLAVEGEGNLWSHRPCVFVFNHQSGVDMLLLAKMLRRDVIGIAKEEVRRNPIFGPAFALTGAVFVDRAKTEKAIEALRPAVEALEQGLSIAIAPEGTRSTSPKPGRFKKGAFHIAMAARVPIVPIVFRNALDALPKHAMFVRPTRVRAVVHPPISTERWTPETLDDEIAKVHALFVETLERGE